MPLDPSYLEYPHRSYGMDHQRYSWEMLADRPPVTWPNGASLAVWVSVALPFYPLDQSNKPFGPTFGMKTPYPDLRHYSLREYGHRVGIYRFFQALDQYEVPASFAVSARLAERYPYLAQRLADRGDEVVCHGWSMNHPHHGELNDKEEAELIRRSIEVLSDATDHEIVGWLSPGKSQSSRTPEHLVENGIQYMGDWVNDELPYLFETQTGQIVSLPLSTELEDATIVAGSFHSVSDYVDQISDAFEMLLKESRAEGGRLLSLSVHPWLMGQPHRIHGFETVLELISSNPEVWVATGRNVVDTWMAQLNPSD